MGKFLKWLFIGVVVVIIIGIIALVLFVKHFDANRYREQITSLISEEIGHPVELGSLALAISLDQGLSVNVHDFAIINNPPQTGRMIAFDDAALGVDVAAFLSSRQIVVTKAALDHPVVHIIREGDGAANIESLVKQKETAPSGAGEAQGAVSPSKEKDFDLARVQINSVEISNGELILEQTGQNDSQTFTVDMIDVTVDNFSFERSFPFRFSCRLFSEQQNISSQGRLVISPQKLMVAIEDMIVRTDLENIDLARVKAFLDQEEGVPVERIKGDLNITVEQLKVVGNKLEDYTFELRLNNGLVSLEQLDHPIENIDMYILGESPHVTIKEIFMYIGAGKIDGKGQIQNVLTKNAAQFNFDLEGVRLEEIVDQTGRDYQLLGELAGQAHLAGSHNELETISDTLDGKADLDIQKARIKNLNVLRTIIEELSVIPGFSQNVKEKLPQRYKDVLSQKDTVIDTATIQSTIKEDQIFIGDATLEAQGFQIKAKGKSDLEQNIYLEADLYMAADLSAVLFSSEDFSFLLGEDGRLHVPFKSYRGPLNRLMIFPDMESISKKAIQTKGKEELKKAIFKALDLEEVKKEPKKEPAQEEPSSQEDQPDQEPAQQPSAEEILIENVLDAIFK